MEEFMSYAMGVEHAAENDAHFMAEVLERQLSAEEIKLFEKFSKAIDPEAGKILDISETISDLKNKLKA